MRKGGANRPEPGAGCLTREPSGVREDAAAP